MHCFNHLTWRLASVLLLALFAEPGQPADSKLTTALGGLPFNQFQEVSKECDPGCTKHGNCNRQLGVCECPFGYSGPSCQTVLFPACRTTTEPGTPIFTGVSIPRNCNCYRQLLERLCLPNDTTRCAAHTLSLWESMHCFEQADVSADRQLSNLPDPLGDPSYRWGRGVRRGSQQAGQWREIEMMDKPPQQEELHDGMPLTKCPNRCSDRGVCRSTGAGSRVGRCQCLAGFDGPDCSEPAATSPLCPHGCGGPGRGQCVGGFCKCKPPYWGIGCAKAKAYEPAPGSVHLPYYPRLKIYMYDIPMSATGPQPFDDGVTDVFTIYQAFIQFMDMLLDDNSGVRTDNPYEANLFYIPAFAFYAGSNLGDPSAAVVRAVDWVSEHLPFYRRSEGRDHFVLLTSDRGACYLKAAPQTKNLIRLVHFGLEQSNLTDLGPAVENTEYGCFKGGRDVVLAPFFKPKGRQIKERLAQLAAPGGAEAMLAAKKTLFFFSGDIRHNEVEYSGGVRQALAQLMDRSHPPDVVFKQGFMQMGPGEYDSLLGSSRFCLAPYGHGWGIRLTHALMHACVPVIIQDKVRQPWEDLLHYPDFSVRVSKADLPRLVDRLRSVPDEDVARMMREGARVYRAFIWQPEHGGLAYNFTLASLRRRLSHTRGELYEAGTRRRLALA